MGKFRKKIDSAPSENVESAPSEKFSKESIRAIYNSATKLYEKVVAAYKQACDKGPQRSDFQWMEKMMKVGTLPDKMAAFVVRIQDSPPHNLHHLQNLIAMVKVQSRQQCLMAADTLKDLFLEDLLPRDRKLISFEKRGSSVTGTDNKTLITWVFEDKLKGCYSSYINALKQMSLDNVEKIRAKAISLIYLLLTTHPEQEAVLLQMLVNKLGDTMKKVASRALFYLNVLLETHPRMKLVVIDEIERLLFRNNIAKRAQYYGVCFLNAINLNNEHPEVACKLISIYVAFFKGCIKTGDIESKMMSALLTGVNKSYPLAKEYGYQFTENTDTLFKIAHLSNFNVSIQALSILFQLTDVDTRPNDADRYYRVLYRELLRPEVATTSHIIQFLNLIYKSMKCDNKVNRVMGFTKRLLRICQNVQPNLVCAILFLLSEVAKVHKAIISCGAVPVENMINDYDPVARNPLYCGAEFSVTHEVATLAKHYHPSVALFAETLLHQKSIRYQGNPLKDFTTTRFLDRFVYRNSKKPKSGLGGRAMYQPKGLRSLAVNSAEYLKNDKTSIPVEEKFFYRYFSEKKDRHAEKPEEASDTESVPDEEFDELMANYFKTKKGKGVADDDDDLSDHLDFAANFSAKQSKKKGKKDEESDEDEPMDGDIDDASDQEEMLDDDADEMIDMDDDDELDFQDEDGLEVFEEDFDEPMTSKKMRKLTKEMDMFAPAEQFAEMLEANADENISGPKQLISKGAGPKQIKWEQERERWAKGYKKNMKSTFKGKKKGQKQRKK